MIWFARAPACIASTSQAQATNSVQSVPSTPSSTRRPTSLLLDAERGLCTPRQSALRRRLGSLLLGGLLLLLLRLGLQVLLVLGLLLLLLGGSHQVPWLRDSHALGQGGSCDGRQAGLHPMLVQARQLLGRLAVRLLRLLVGQARLAEALRGGGALLGGLRGQVLGGLGRAYRAVLHWLRWRVLLACRPLHMRV